MSLVQCPDCKKPVSDQAPACPNCGFPIADQHKRLKPEKSSKGGCGWVIVLVIGCIVAFAFTVGSDQQKETSNPTCKSDWSRCSDNADLANNYTGWFDVKYACEKAANKLAKYGDPKFGSFGTFYKGTEYVKTGIAVAIDTDAKFQNGFGAMTRSTVTCKYDLRSKTVIDATVSAN